MNLCFLGTELQNLIYQIELKTTLYLISHSQSSGVGRADTDRPLNQLKTQIYICNTFAVYQENILKHVVFNQLEAKLPYELVILLQGNCFLRYIYFFFKKVINIWKIVFLDYFPFVFH